MPKNVILATLRLHAHCVWAVQHGKDGKIVKDGEGSPENGLREGEGGPFLKKREVIKSELSLRKKGRRIFWVIKKYFTHFVLPLLGLCGQEEA